MASRWIRWWMLILAGMFAGCSAEPSTGPAEVRWDRDQCERCRMVLSDRHHAAQIRRPNAQGRSRVYRFDDVGCAVIWLDGKGGPYEPGVEFWVTDHRTGDWIDATTAIYVTGHLTPMGYGLGAQRGPVANSLTFEQARRHVHEAEDHAGLPGGHGGATFEEGR